MSTNIRKGIRAFDKSGKQGYMISHANKILYPDKTSLTGLTTLTEALGNGTFKFESNLDTVKENNLGNPVVDPVVEDYINKLLCKYITEIFTIKSSDWTYNGEMKKYTLQIGYPGMTAGMYPSYGLIPKSLLPTEIELSEFKKIECVVGQEDALLLVATNYPKTTLDIIIRGISDYGGRDANLESIQTEIDELRTIIASYAPVYKTVNLVSNKWSNNLYTIKDDSITANSSVEISVDKSIDKERYINLARACIIPYTSDIGYITLKALNGKPTLDNIPIILKITNVRS